MDSLNSEVLFLNIYLYMPFADVVNIYSFYSFYTCIQGTSAATDMSEESFVSFSADLTEQEYFNFSVSGKQHATP